MANTHSLKTLLKSIYTSQTAEQLFPISINWHQGEFLASLIRQHRPELILELGSGFGVSSVWMQSVISRKGTHIAVDPWANHLPEIKKLLPRKNYSLVTTHTSQEYLAKNLTSLRGKLDFVFMDADNRFDGCLTDCYFVNQALKPDGLIVIRNCWNPSIRKVCQFMLSNLPYQLVSVPNWVDWLVKRIPTIGKGWLLYHATQHYSAELCVLKKVAPDNREWDHFKTFC